MTRRRLRFAALAGVVGALSFPAAASAGPFSALGQFFGEYRNGGDLVQPLGPAGRAIALFGYDITGQQNYQTVSGTIGNAAFSGFLFAHTYDHATDHVTYKLQGHADPSGAAPPQPAALYFSVDYDRIAEKNTVSITGTINGQEFIGQTETMNIPTPYQLLG